MRGRAQQVLQTRKRVLILSVVDSDAVLDSVDLTSNRKLESTCVGLLVCAVEEKSRGLELSWRDQHLHPIPETALKRKFIQLVQHPMTHQCMG